MYFLGGLGGEILGGGQGVVVVFIMADDGIGKVAIFHQTEKGENHGGYRREFYPTSHENLRMNAKSLIFECLRQRPLPMMKRGYDNSHAISLVSFPAQGGGKSLIINTLQYFRRIVDPSPVRRFRVHNHL